ncbi:FxsA family protein [Falsigemmobacter faecalis]|uniref:FxsA family protein n=1 Tax=Falsigemmobacter faecalis TaxID=2488730 RepID=A0A3P3DUP1_9RHOB|nr:FxsA family protein [Falsigemmobacter faecalis]RRH77909.1 hypothetical protein EG244_02480 [Falsigemmobacter faecalis]
MKGLSLRVLLPLLLWPLAEIFLFVIAGDLLGFWPTVLWLVAALLIGSSMMRSVGRPPNAGAAGVMRGFVGLLLFLPGFLSDFVALLLLLPPVRRLIGGWIVSRLMAGQSRVFTFRGFERGPGPGPRTAAPGAAAEGDIIDGEATEIRSAAPPLPGQGGRSGWHQPD